MKKQKRPEEKRQPFEAPKVIATFEKKQLEELVRPHLSLPGYR